MTDFNHTTDHAASASGENSTHPKAPSPDYDERIRGLAHDLRAPQSSILALLELQKDPANALPQDELYRRIEHACRKTLHLTDGFAELFRAESHEYAFAETSFQDILHDAVDDSWSMAQTRGVYLLTEIGEGDYPVQADRSLLMRAITHLLSNAVRVSPRGAQVICTMEVVPAASARMIRCGIRDQGSGISTADQNRLFRCFERLAGNDRGVDDDDGAGLGLVFAKTVVERHGGVIELISALGAGSTFTVMLPLDHQDHAPA